MYSPLLTALSNCTLLSYIINSFVFSAAAVINLAQLRVNSIATMFLPEWCIYGVIKSIIN